MSLISSDRVRAVVGLGVSGVSTANFLAKQGLDFFVVDSRENPPGLEQVKTICPEDRIYTGSLDALKELGVTELFVSPGIALSTPILKELAAQGVQMRGDIDLFRDYVKAPFVAITGSNAKSTVTTLLNELLLALGKKSVAGGNLGRPALDLLDDQADIYVLELSSFQLETTHHLQADVACLLNVSEDHMDRYDDLYSYQRAKQRIYRGCKAAVCNKQDILTAPLLAQNTPVRAFTKGMPDLKEFGLIKDDEGAWLCHGVKRLLNTQQVRLKGEHNYANVLACLAMLDVMGLPVDAPEVFAVLEQYAGLPHRCETVRELNDVVFINDSKGTNVGATMAALEGLGDSKTKSIHLLLGGVGKGADFSPLAPVIEKYVKQVYVFGKDADQIIDIIPTDTPCSRYQDLSEVIGSVKNNVKAGDIVLFSPACASFDQYKSFEHRGMHFQELVNLL